MKVIHYIDTFLPLTCNWIYNHIIFNKRVTPIIVTQRVSDLGAYPLNNGTLYCFEKRSALIKFFQKIRGFTFKQKLNFYLCNIIQKEKIDLIHAHFGYNAAQILDTRLNSNVPLITSFYGADISFLPKKSEEWVKRYHDLFFYGDAFIVEGPYLKKQLMKHGCPEEKIYINHLGVNLEKIEYSPRRASSDQFHILIAATFREKKGIPYALQAIGALSNKYKIHTHLVGDATELSLIHI